jgi:hypothetical protein
MNLHNPLSNIAELINGENLVKMAHYALGSGETDAAIELSICWNLNYPKTQKKPLSTTLAASLGIPHLQLLSLFIKRDDSAQ